MLEQYGTGRFMLRRWRLATCVALVCLATGCVFGSQDTDDNASNDGSSSDARDDTSAEDSTTQDSSDSDQADVAPDVSCDDALISCTGECIDPQTSVEHCGDCDEACVRPPNATATCDAGACVFECESGFSDLDGDLQDADSNGCEGECAPSETEVYYLDADDDGYGRPETGQTFCIGTQGAGRVANNRDCDDNDALANPEGTFQDQPRSGGSYDYNCDGVETPEYPNGAVCDDPFLGSCSFSTGWDNGVPGCGETGDFMTACCDGEETQTRTQGCR